MTQAPAATTHTDLQSALMLLKEWGPENVMGMNMPDDDTIPPAIAIVVNAAVRGQLVSSVALPGTYAPARIGSLAATARSGGKGEMLHAVLHHASTQPTTDYVSLLEAELRGMRNAAVIALNARGYDYDHASYRAIMKRVAALTDGGEPAGADPMADIAKQDWKDKVFRRVYTSEIAIWHVENAVQGVLDHHFDSKADAEAWIANELPYRSEIERWARVVDKTLWDAFDANGQVREKCGPDDIACSLRNAIRVHAALGEGKS